MILTYPPLPLVPPEALIEPVVMAAEPLVKPMMPPCPEPSPLADSDPRFTLPPTTSTIPPAPPWVPDTVMAPAVTAVAPFKLTVPPLPPSVPPEELMVPLTVTDPLCKNTSAPVHPEQLLLAVKSMVDIVDVEPAAMEILPALPPEVLVDPVVTVPPDVLMYPVVAKPPARMLTAPPLYCPEALMLPVVTEEPAVSTTLAPLTPREVDSAPIEMEPDALREICPRLVLMLMPEPMMLPPLVESANPPYPAELAIGAGDAPLVVDVASVISPVEVILTPPAAEAVSVMPDAAPETTFTASPDTPMLPPVDKITTVGACRDGLAVPAEGPSILPCA